MTLDHLTAKQKELIEKLAAIEHKRWAHWQRYLHSQCLKNDDGSLTFPADLVKKWNKKIDTDYFNLTESEKDSDREQVLKYLPLLNSFTLTNKK